jgi:hypothetical protein
VIEPAAIVSASIVEAGVRRGDPSGADRGHRNEHVAKRREAYEDRQNEQAQIQYDARRVQFATDTFSAVLFADQASENQTTENSSQNLAAIASQSYEKQSKLSAASLVADRAENRLGVG